jgi:glycerol-3-phosphate dehydrogenase (NAD(P)+)
MSKPKIAVVGGGAWGTALALVAARAGNDVTLWAREAEVVQAINTRRENPLFLPGVTLDDGIEATTDFAELGAAKAVLLVVPTQPLRSVVSQLADALAAKVPLIICAKGIEQKTLELPTEIVAEAAPGHPLAVLSGPSFAIDVARGLPTAVTLAAEDEALATELARLIALPTFRPYHGGDPRGAEIGGAVKNVLAIACGIAEGRKLGQSAKAALITRGFAEMARMGTALGAKFETMTGLSGLGDLILTCSSPQSRNMSLGIALGEGRKLADVLAERRAVTEGVGTAPALVELAAKTGIEMPIAAAVNEIIRERMSVDEAIEALLARPMRSEAAN